MSKTTANTTPKTNATYYINKDAFVITDPKDSLDEVVDPDRATGNDIIKVYATDRHDAKTGKYLCLGYLTTSHDKSGIHFRNAESYVGVSLYNDDTPVHARNMLRYFYRSDAYKDSWKAYRKAKDLTAKQNQLAADTKAVNRKLAAMGLSPKGNVIKNAGVNGTKSDV